MFSKTMREFEYHAPKSLGEALDLLAEYRDFAKPMLGGTDLVPKMKAQVATPQNVIALKQIDELKNISYSESEGLHIGAAVSLYDIETFPALREHYPALYQGVHAIANTQIRDVGTIVGNICNAVPSADSAPSLLAYDASVVIESKDDGKRIVPLSEFFAGVCKTIVRPDELVTEVIVPTPAPGTRAVYYDHTVRKALDLAMVGVAAVCRMDGSKVEDIKLALGAVADRPRRAFNAEEIIAGKEITPELIDEAALVASEQDCMPITDMRATADYRRELVRVLTRNALIYCSGCK